MRRPKIDYEAGCNWYRFYFQIRKEKDIWCAREYITKFLVCRAKSKKKAKELIEHYLLNVGADELLYEMDKIIHPGNYK